MLKVILLVYPYLNLYAVSTVLINKYRGANVGVENFLSNVLMFVPTRANAKLADGNTGHAQLIRIVLCHFTNCTIICPIVTDYYCSDYQ